MLLNNYTLLLSPQILIKASLFLFSIFPHFFFFLQGEEDICSLPKESGRHCGEERYYFDSVSNRCLSFDFRGRWGNANNFDTKEECENRCISKEYKQSTSILSMIFPTDNISPCILVHNAVYACSLFDDFYYLNSIVISRQCPFIGHYTMVHYTCLHIYSTLVWLTSTGLESSVHFRWPRGNHPTWRCLPYQLHSSSETL